jgi:hypothetical protein
MGLPAPANIIQTMLVKDRYFVGWKFRYDGGYAILRSGQIEFFDEQGTLLKVVGLVSRGALIPATAGRVDTSQ